MRITLFLTEQGWMARYSGSGSQRILEAFDTDTIPTAYTPEAPAETVLAVISELNQNAEVVLGESIVCCACTDGIHGRDGCRNPPSPLNDTAQCQNCNLDLCNPHLSNSILLN